MFAYEPAVWGSGVTTCRPGAMALLEFVHSLGFDDLGCFNDRAVRGTTDVASTHAEGRAVDVTLGANPAQRMHDLCSALVAGSDVLGVQRIIWSGLVWTVGADWHPYQGPAGQHLDHAHIELTREAAEANTLALYVVTLTPLLASSPSEDYDTMQPPLLFRPAGYANVFAIFATGEVIHCDTALVAAFEREGSVEPITGAAPNLQTLHSLLVKAGCSPADAVPLDTPQP